MLTLVGDTVVALYDSTRLSVMGSENYSFPLLARRFLTLGRKGPKGVAVGFLFGCGLEDRLLRPPCMVEGEDAEDLANPNLVVG